ncbi:hypothetical protein VNO78_09174 [Psophocarpus tetragonolobus]|uniref:Uncharacterized protein n=1 Tax=Psophocarpus tetragonolobus TaxID=3891 RepID=A0AAN9SZ03_PSOTE
MWELVSVMEQVRVIEVIRIRVLVRIRQLVSLMKLVSVMKLFRIKVLVRMMELVSAMELFNVRVLVRVMELVKGVRQGDGVDVDDEEVGQDEADRVDANEKGVDKGHKCCGGTQPAPRKRGRPRKNLQPIYSMTAPKNMTTLDENMDARDGFIAEKEVVVDVVGDVANVNDEGASSKKMDSKDIDVCREG